MESMPLMLIEVEADSKVWFMYYLRLEYGGTLYVLFGSHIVD